MSKDEYTRYGEARDIGLDSESASQYAAGSHRLEAAQPDALELVNALVMAGNIEALAEALRYLLGVCSQAELKHAVNILENDL